MSTTDLSHLSWYRLRVVLACTRLVPNATRHLPQVMQALVKGVTDLTEGRTLPDAERTVFFHLTDRRYSTPPRQGEQIPLELFFCSHDQEYVERWRQALAAYLDDPVQGRNYSLVEAGEPELRTLTTLVEENPDLPTEGELCLDFYTPFPFRHPDGKPRTFLTEQQFVNQLCNRFTRLFNRGITCQPGDDSWYLLPFYWQYTEIRHASKSQPGNSQYLNGCIGKLYLRGRFSGLLPFLLLASELHIGTKLSNSSGYFRLPSLSPPAFCRQFPHKKAIHAAVVDVLERYDTAAESLAASECYPFHPEKLAETLAQQIGDGSYTPIPATAFAIKKKNGEDRIIEQLSFRDMIVQQYLLGLVAEPFDRILERGAIGFRRGMSRHSATELVHEALAQGYGYIIESDIEAFFPSLDHQRLERLLATYLPEGDAPLQRLIMSCVRTPCSLNGRLVERTRGVAQGSPLSPLLANLYLDSFDELVASWGVKIIRFSDDFIIMTRTAKEAEAILAQAEGALHELGLTISKDKTAIRHIGDGFRFLGLHFDGSGPVDESAQEPTALKKPLYITEPYVFLSLEAESVNIVKQKQVVESIPLRRISEIFVLEKASFSTGLVRRCADFKVPLTLTLNSGYFVATIKPDSKQYFDISYQHAHRYYQLTDTEKLCFAKEFAAGKITNYAAFLRQRYHAGLAQFLHELEQVIARIHQAADVNQVRGYEGAVAKNIYTRLNSMIENPAFHLKKRGRKVKDPINALLNFAYYLLFSRINNTVRGVGLNPYLGFLHSPHDNYESLVCDIEELFRARIDRLVVRCINLKVITETDMIDKGGRMVLNQQGTKKFLRQFEAEMERKNSKTELSLKDHIYAQVQTVKRCMLEGASLSLYRWQV